MSVKSRFILLDNLGWGGGTLVIHKKLIITSRQAAARVGV